MDDTNRERSNALYAEADSLHTKIDSLQHKVTKAARAFTIERESLSTYEFVKLSNEIVLQRKEILSLLSEFRMLRDEARAASGDSSLSRSRFSRFKAVS